MGVKIYDWKDPQIVEMVKMNHRPKESWIKVYGGSSLAGITCDECDEDWPCSTILSLRNQPRLPGFHHEA